MVTLNCGHKAELNNIFEHQWFDGFSTNDNLFCPVCKQKLSSHEFNKITDLLCKHKYLQKHTIYDTHLFPTNILRTIVEPEKLYDNLHNFYMFWFEKYPDWESDEDIFNETRPDIVYFEKHNHERFKNVNELFFGNPNDYSDEELISNDHVSYRFVFK